MLVGRNIIGTAASGGPGFTPDTAPWSIPDDGYYDMGTGASWVTMVVRFGVVNGLDRGRIVTFTAAAGFGYPFPGSHHEDENTAVFTGADFEVMGTHVGGNCTLNNGVALDTWHTLAAQRDFSFDNGGTPGSYNNITRFKIRRVSDGEILADGQIEQDGVKT